jgi:hypothetical protein
MEFFTTEELAERWRIKPTTLGVWRKIGKGPEFVLLGDGPKARALYRVADVEAWERRGGDDEQQ